MNKVNTRVELRFDINHSQVLTPNEKYTLVEKLQGRINKKGTLFLAEQGHRSQARNKEEVTNRFIHLVEAALQTSKTRKATHPGLHSKIRRLKLKHQHAEKKKRRQKQKSDNDA